MNTFLAKPAKLSSENLGKEDQSAKPTDNSTLD